TLGVGLQLAEVPSTDSPEKIDAAFEALARRRTQAVLGLQGPHYYRERKRVCDLAIRHGFPGAFEVPGYPEAGCLMSYGASLSDLWRRSASYVDKILRGAKAADLPVEQPTKFDLVVNINTAKALGITIPPAFLLRVDRVIERVTASRKPASRMQAQMQQRYLMRRASAAPDPARSPAARR